VVHPPYFLKEFLEMSRKRFALGMALALMGLMSSAPRADAAYSYTAAFANVTASIGGSTVTNAAGTTFTSNNGTVVTLGNILTPGSFLVGQPLLANFGNINVTTTSATPENFTINYTINGTLTDPFPGGPSFTASTTGTLTFTGIQFIANPPPGASAGTISNQYTGTLVVGPGTFPNGDTFTTSVSGTPNAFFASPTVNGQGGSLGGLIVSTNAVPEPASIAMVGLGLVGLGGFSAYRRRRAS